jgi:hypothetical protein
MNILDGRIFLCSPVFYLRARRTRAMRKLEIADAEIMRIAIQRRFSRKEMRLKRALDFVGKCGLVSVIVSHE